MLKNWIALKGITAAEYKNYPKRHKFIGKDPNLWLINTIRGVKAKTFKSLFLSERKVFISYINKAAFQMQFPKMSDSSLSEKGTVDE